MTAGLVSAQANVTNPKTNVQATGARASARSSVEVKDSCNCFKFCFPCWSSKKTEKRSDADNRVQGLATDTLQRTEGTDSARQAHIRRSPAYDDMTDFAMMPRQHQQQSVTVTVHCDHSPGTTPQQSSPVASDSSESTGKSQ